MANLKFRTKYQREETFTPVGDPVYPQYVGRYDQDGVLVLDKVGESNIYNEIQSHADSVDLDTIIRRYESGEIDVLSRAQGAYVDVTQAPKTYADMLNLMRYAEEVFDQLPLEVRQQYDNSFEQFFAQDGMSQLLQKAEPVADQEDVKESASDES